ncbi:hypothetical protein DH2020_043802 [Rehmannia glutinosa]|uniref:Uncharacterized protein n=1 Tax=Rehmannia glutinosa TaxID=99300 RepID=A0ABR0UIP5_REHGL
MKRERDFIELSEDEWSHHSDSFKPSRVLKPQPTSQNPPPPIESFAFSKTTHSTTSTSNAIHIIESSSSEELGNANGNEFEDLEDEDADMEVSRSAATVTRGNRFVIDDDDDEDDHVGNKVGDFSDHEVWLSEEEEEEEEDVVKKALRKCEKISAELKRELYGTSSVVCDRYSEVELGSSAAKIVTQDDVNDACGAGDSILSQCSSHTSSLESIFLCFSILADEMGLGKTVQELKKWCPSFTVLQYHGSARSAYSKELSSLGKAGMPPPFDVILVCYSLFERHSAQQKDDRKILRHWKWSCVIMDEAHALKDKNSYRWKNLMSVARNARQRLMLTGTPLQNDLHVTEHDNGMTKENGFLGLQQELWSMLEFMMPDIFETGDVDLKKLLNAEDRDLIGRIKSILGPFILRRLKSDVMQQLVPKTQKIANHPLLVRRIFTDDDVVHFAKMLHPKGVFGSECTFERVIEELKSYNDFSIHRLLLYYGDDDLKEFFLMNMLWFLQSVGYALAELLPALNRSGSRVLIFSQWTSMLDILEWTLDVIGVTYRRLDGRSYLRSIRSGLFCLEVDYSSLAPSQTKVTERQTIVDTFNKDTSIFACLLSTRAGGQGLNLIGADTVIIHDMDFNPQIDRQAEDRCHRIGQTKPVTVYR